MPDKRQDMISIDFLKKQLAENGQVLTAMLTGLEEEIYSWKPNPDAWSILEILCHLVDEEKEDFRVRMKYAIDNKQEPHMIDPEGWVTDRRYAENNFGLKLDEFRSERKASIDWLGSIDNKDLEKKWEHPKLGPLTAHHFAANWLAHDLLHTRQITRNKYQFIKDKSENSCEYAGKWA